MDTEARQQCKKTWLLPQDLKIFYYNFKEDHFMKETARVDQHFSKGAFRMLLWDD